MNEGVDERVVVGRKESLDVVICIIFIVCVLVCRLNECVC